MNVAVLCVSTKWVGNATRDLCTFEGVDAFLAWCKTVWGEAPDLVARGWGTGEWFDKASGERVLVRAY